MSFAFSKSVPIAPAKGRGKRTPAWTNRRAKALVPCGFADAKTAKGILQYQKQPKRLSNCPRIPREEVRKYGSFQSGAKYGIYRYEQPPLAKQGIVLKGKGLVVANAFAARRLDYTLAGLSHINREKIDAIREAVKELEKAGYIVRSRERDEKGRLRAQITSYTSSRSRESRKQLPAADSRLYWIYLHWKIQHWIIQRWKNLRRKNLRWKIQRN